VARNVRLLALCFALCVAPPIVAQEAGHYGPLVDANTRFAFKFFRQALLKTPDSNVLAAPIAFSRDFAFLQNGADLEAREEILRAFEFGNLSPKEINQQSLALHKALSYPRSYPRQPQSQRHRNQEVAPPPICREPPPERVILSGSLWAQPNVVFRSAFLERSKTVLFVPDRIGIRQGTRRGERGEHMGLATDGWCVDSTF
jgi:hypothetical protein